MNGLRVAVICGGSSKEREISLISGEEVYKALAGRGYQAIKIDLDVDISEHLKEARPDVVFIALHGRLGEDGAIQGLLEILGIPYTGSKILASALGLNKIVTKKLLKFEGIPTAEFIPLARSDFISGAKDVFKEIISKLDLPLVVKPACEGSTIGMSIVKREADLAPALSEAFRYDEEVLVEEYIEGTEITVGVLGNRDLVALPTLEIAYEGEIYDYESKYTAGMSHHVIPARIPEAANEAAQELATRVHKTLFCRGFSRVDFIVSKNGTPYVLEINTSPGMTPLSLFPDAAKAAGMDMGDLVSRIVELALEEPK